MKINYALIFLLFTSLLCETSKFNFELADNVRSKQILDVINMAYRKVPFIKECCDRIDLNELESIIQSDNKQLHCCMIEGVICGVVLLDLSKTFLEMRLFAVHPNYQGQGIGKVIMDYVEHRAKCLKKDIYIHVIPVCQESLLSYYIKNGYKFTGEFEVLDSDTVYKVIKPEYRDKMITLILKKQIL